MRRSAPSSCSHRQREEQDVAGSPGRLVIQTYQPDHYSIQTAKEQNYEAFYEQEILYREMMLYPPVWNMLVVLCASKWEQTAYDCASKLAEQTGGEQQVQVIGPADAAVAKVNDIYKKVLYLKAKDYGKLVEIKNRLEHFMRDNRAFSDTIVQFDFNPVNGF